jgi:hypothetical protein
MAVPKHLLLGLQSRLAVLMSMDLTPGISRAPGGKLFLGNFMDPDHLLCLVVVSKAHFGLELVEEGDLKVS